MSKGYILSLKENVEYIKEELSSEEKLFEKAVVTERFLKKYKKSIIAVLSLIVIVALGSTAYKMKEQNRIEEANAQLAILDKNPANMQAQNKLKELSPKLYTVWSFARAVTTNDTKKLSELKNAKLPVIDDIAAYEVASRTSDLKELQNYALRQEAIYKDLARVESAVIFMNKNETEKAKEQLALISEKSPLKGVAAILNHYGVK